MSLGLKDRIETAVEHAASALFGGAVAFAVNAALTTRVPAYQAYLGAGGAAALAFFLCIRMLKGLSPGQQLAVASFEAPDFGELEADDELLLTDADRFLGELVLTDADRVDGDGPLVLDEVLLKIGPDSRVVRLFDRKGMPTPGQLQSRIDDHLGHGTGGIAAPDASQALSEALAELRRSLR
ncbi:MAG: hypothetical protein ACJ8FI_12495 [Sphingomicrobium sp.]